MKRKHKIGIAAGVISLSMVTAMATGLINTGNLFAEDPKSIPSSVQFQPGDMVNIGGKQFTVLNDNQLLPDLSNAINQVIIQIKSADYTFVDQEISQIPDDLSLYTNESVKAVIDAKNAIIRNKKNN